MIPLESVDYDTFFPLIGQTFSSGDAEGRVELVLSVVEKLGHRREDAPRDPFSLTFRGPQGLRVPQGTYRLECDGLGKIGLFITQVGDGAKGSEFEAVFT
ncbi:MAG: hypothetical protein ABIT37_11860 [Luteolibacter sp.]